MAYLDLTFYHGTDDYSDGDYEENYLLEMAKSGKTLEDIPEEARSWAVFYHMTPIRENICNWYPFKEHASVLEIGAGCGAVTGILCQKAEKVTAVELSKRRAEINYERNKKYSNLNILVGNMNDISLQEKYDYITLIGVLEYAGRFTDGDQPFQSFLKSLKKYLKPDGVILIAIENRLGLKYFSGAPEDHTNRAFEGINSYPNYNGVRTFSKAELSELLERSGLNHYQFYYPYPDYKLPTEIFTDASICRNKRPYQTYDSDRLSLFYEADVFNALSKDKTASSLFNSFFVEASACEISHESSLVYAKLNQERKEKYRIGTFIFRQGEKTFVEKRAIHPSAVDHIQNLSRNEQKQYGKITALNGTLQGNTLVYPYLRTNTLETILAHHAKNGDNTRIVEILQDFFGQCFSDAKLCRYDTPEFQALFGSEKLKEQELVCAEPANLDIVLSNVFLDDNSYRMIDCEWVADFPVPISFICWRVIRALYISVPEIGSYTGKTELLERLGIPEEYTEVFEKWEDHFVFENVCSSGQGIPKKNVFYVPEYGRDERLAQEISRLQMDLSARENELSKIQQQVSLQEEEVLRLKERVNYFVNCISSASQKIDYLSGLKGFKLVHLLTRIRCQLFSRDSQNRRSFWCWLKNHLCKRAEDDRSYNPLYQIQQELYGSGDNSPEYIPPRVPVFWKDAQRIDIITPGHTLFVAKQLAAYLAEVGIQCNIHSQDFVDYEDIPYIVICAQIMKQLPPHYICYQMEQTINSRWLTDAYLQILENAYAIFDYSLVNIAYFNQYETLKKKLYYVPIGVAEACLEEPQVADQKIDILFYGDINCDRRRRILAELQKDFNVHIETNLFGEDMLNQIRNAKIVLNIHYYEDALLETTRVAEIASLGSSIIVSERSNDTEEDKRMAGLVDFVEIDDIAAMKERIHYWLNNPKAREERLSENRATILSKIGDSKFFFNRFLLANDKISFDEFYRLSQQFISVPENLRWCLHLPEDIEREKAFAEENKYQFSIFPGLKHTVGWVGCAMSYKFMFCKLRDTNASRAIICEDDVFFDDQFSGRLDSVMQYLEENDQWDLFSGFMADIKDNARILGVDNADGDKIALIDRMVSTVFNIYNKRAIQIGSQWNPQCRDTANTIDRYFEMFDMRIAIGIPYLAGHKENLKSTLWGGNNGDLYDEMTNRTIARLSEMIAEYEETA